MRKDVKKGKMMIGLLLLIGVIGVGYAALNANLKINGVANISSASWDVHFKSGSIAVSSGSVTGTNVTTAATITNATQVDYAVKLALPGDFYEFTVVAENTGTIDAMIDSVSSKLGTTEITTGTLPSYIDYSVTYADGIEIQPKHLLSKNTEETYKVRIEFKKDIEANQLPGEATTLNLNFQINYVQADDTAVAKPDPYTYGVYPYANDLYLSQAVPANAILHSTPSDALADWTNASVMNKASQLPFYLKHKIENDVVTESYVVFTVTPEMVAANSGMVAGTYELRGEKTYENGAYIVGEDYISPYYETNKEVIKTAFGYSINPSRCIESGTGRSSNFRCPVSGLDAGASANGGVGAYGRGGSGCGVNSSGGSNCG